jgi:cupin superfamily acireductone dioxygenase involved in methionine salvage
MRKEGDLVHVPSGVDLYLIEDQDIKKVRTLEEPKKLLIVPKKAKQVKTNVSESLCRVFYDNEFWYVKITDTYLMEK